MEDSSPYKANRVPGKRYTRIPIGWTAVKPARQVRRGGHTRKVERYTRLYALETVSFSAVTGMVYSMVKAMPLRSEGSGEWRSYDLLEASAGLH